MTSSAVAQTTYTAQPAIVSAAAGPGQMLTAAIEFGPQTPTTEVSSFSLSIGYDSNLGSLIAVEDNTGQPGADIEYMLSSPQPLADVAYADVYHKLGMSTAFNLISPSTLALLKFTTSSSYQAGDEFPIFLDKFPLDQAYGGIYAGAEQNFARIPVSFLSLEPTSSVQYWTLY